MHTLTENVKKREVQYTPDTLENKTKDCNHNLYQNKKNMLDKKNQQCNQLTRVNAKNMKGNRNVKHKKKHDYTTPTT